MFIYIITNLINGKQYVGQTTQSLEQRFKRHCSPCNEECMCISRAIKKHRKENFIIELIETCESMLDLNLKETFYIEKYNTLVPNGYNLSSGGGNKRMHETTKKKIGEKLAAKPKHPDHVKKVVESRKEFYRNNPEKVEQHKAKGHTFNEIQRKNLSEAKGQKYVGVFFCKKKNHFRCEFYFKRKRISLTFNTEIEAAHAYDTMLVKHGMNPINFPEEIWSEEIIENIRLKRRNRKSKFFGVRQIKNRFQAMIWLNGCSTYIGSFKDEISAAKAVDLFLVENSKEPMNRKLYI